MLSILSAIIGPICNLLIILRKNEIINVKCKDFRRNSGDWQPIEGGLGFDRVLRFSHRREEINLSPFSVFIVRGDGKRTDIRPILASETTPI